MRPHLFDPDHDAYRSTVRRFVAEEVVDHMPDWRIAGMVDPVVYRRAGDLGLLGTDVPESYGGGGVDDLRFSVILNEELTLAGAGSLVMNLCGFNDLVAPYLLQLGTEEQ